MGAEHIIVRISPDGIVEAGTKGFKGPKCLDSIEMLERILEAQTVTSAFTPEYEEAPALTTPDAEIEDDDDLRQY